MKGNMASVNCDGKKDLNRQLFLLAVANEYSHEIVITKRRLGTGNVIEISCYLWEN